MCAMCEPVTPEKMGTGVSPPPYLVLEWMAFLSGIESLTAREAQASDRVYLPCSMEILREAAIQAAAQGLRPRCVYTPPVACARR
jgi:hypothetical protein